MGKFLKLTAMEIICTAAPEANMTQVVIFQF
jgi:hypothetical protein